jgi:chemotaxis protein CheD
MQTVIEVGTADLAVAGAGYTITSGGIGSCVVVCLYDKVQKIGALCHVMLPQHPPDNTLSALRFADTAIPLALEKMTGMGADVYNLTAEVFGGANMFQNLGSFVNRIGAQNVDAVERVLQQYSIPITRLDVGGSEGRSVQFSLDTGTASVATRR